MRLLLLAASACAIGKRTQIKRARRSEAEAKALPHCNATDLALGLPGGVWRAAPDRRASGFGADAAPGAAPDQYAKPVHDFAPATCRLRRFDARDFAGRCAAGRRVAFLGDSLGEQVWKALLGLLAHGGARAERAASRASTARRSTPSTPPRASARATSSC
ncbi:hypothetical protein JL722_4132 [Aureococcus anophagefferens]|nr:hypothetical protein JL722_4132 [Aureococcus anophagefferens]